MKELEIGKYSFPSDCRAIVHNGQMVEIVKRKSRCLSPTEYRCKDCKHRVKGHTTSSVWETFVCELKPKPARTNGDRHQMFYSANAYGKPCDSFELR